MDSQAASFVKREADDDEPPPAKRLRPSFGDIASVKVNTGDAAQVFNIHQNLLQKYSKFFRAANTELRVELPRVRPSTFELFATWTYDTEIDLAVTAEAVWRNTLPSERLKGEWQGKIQQELLARAWILGRSLGAISYMNAAMSSLLKMGTPGLFPLHSETMVLITEKVKPNAKLYAWMLEGLVSVLNPHSVVVVMESWPKKLAEEVVKQLVRNGLVNRRPTPSMTDRERFMEAENDVA